MKIVLHCDSGLQGLTFKRPTLAKSQFCQECDLTLIVNRFLKTGQLPSLSGRVPIHGDFTDAPDDYAQLQETICDIKNRFAGEPKELRERLHDSVENYIEYLALSEEERASIFTPPGSDPTPPAEPLKSPVINEQE